MHDMRSELASLGGGAHALATQILGNSDDAAKGAAIGGLLGGMRQSRRNRALNLNPNVTRSP